jgi:WhiB family redox-sensing transcriptional regulator
MSPPIRFGDGRGRPHEDWVVQGACRRPGVDLSDFHPDPQSKPKAATLRAKNVCAPCPVRSECRAWGDLVSPEFGIFGGLTAGERKARRAQLRGAA